MKNVWKMNFSLRTSLWLILGLVFVLLNAFSLRAHTSGPAYETVSVRSTDVRVYFPFDSDELRTDYLGNDVSLATLDSAIRVIGVDSLESLLIIGSSSPEGNYDYNVDLAHRRSASLKRYLVSKYPSLAGRIELADGSVALNATRPEWRKSRFAALRLVLPFGPDAKSGSKSSFGSSCRDNESVSEWSYRVSRYGVGTSDVTTGAQDAASAGRIMFSDGKTEFDPAYMGNHHAVAMIDEMVARYGVGSIDSLIITVPASAGADSDTQKLNERRAASIVELIKSRHPELANKIVVVESKSDSSAAASKDGAAADKSGKDSIGFQVICPAAKSGAEKAAGTESGKTAGVEKAAGAEPGKTTGSGSETVSGTESGKVAGGEKATGSEKTAGVESGKTTGSGSETVSGTESGKTAGADKTTGTDSKSGTASEKETVAGAIVFGSGKENLDASSAANLEAIALIDSTIARCGAENIDSLIIIVPASAGADSDTQKLNERRAASIVELIKSRHPELANKIVVAESKSDSSAAGSKDGAAADKSGKDSIGFQVICPAAKSGAEKATGTESGKTAGADKTTGTDSKSGTASEKETVAGAIVFGSGKENLDASSAANLEAIALIDSTIARCGAENIDSLIIIVPASADADSDTQKLNERRAASIVELIKSRHPELASKIVVAESKSDSSAAGSKDGAAADKSGKDSIGFQVICPAAKSGAEKAAGTESGKTAGAEKTTGTDSKSGSEKVSGTESGKTAGAEKTTGADSKLGTASEMVSDKDSKSGTDSKSDAKSGSKSGFKASGRGKESVSEWSYRVARYGEDAADDTTGEQEDAASGRVMFSDGEDSIDSGFMGNHYAIALIDSTIAHLNVDNIDSLVISVPVSSDDDPASRELSERRGAYMLDFVKSRYPELADKIRLSNARADESARDTDGMHSDKDGACTGKKNARKDYVEFRVIGHKAPVVEEPETVVAPEFDDSEIQEEGIEIDDEIAVSRDTTEIAPMTYEPETVTTIVRTPFFTVTTNLLYEIGGGILTGFHSIPLNVGVEVPIGEHWSVYSNYLATAPWRAWNNNAECAELIHLDLGAKWYPGGSFAYPFARKADRTVLDGWYAYAAAGAGYYDFERKGKGYQGEEILGSLGIGYGVVLGHNWSLDLAIGVGPMFTKYRYYEARNNNEHLMYQYSGTMQYFGVTDAKVTLRYLIHRNKKVKTEVK